MEGAEHSGEGLDVGAPYVGARVQVLFVLDGKRKWYGGQIKKQKKQAGKWLVRFDDGDEDTIVWPDSAGEVRILSAANCDEGGQEVSKRPRGRPRKDVNEEGQEVSKDVNEEGFKVQEVAKRPRGRPKKDATSLTIQDAEAKEVSHATSSPAAASAAPGKAEIEVGCVCSHNS
jgi:hypothetical protein